LTSTTRWGVNGAKAAGMPAAGLEACPTYDAWSTAGERVTSRPPAGLPVWHARLRTPRDRPVWQAGRLEELTVVRWRSYQIPISFHQAKPTVDQMARLASEIKKPTYHQRRNGTYSCAKNMGEGVVP